VSLVAACLALFAQTCLAQASGESLKPVLERLDELERQNRELLTQIQALRAELQGEQHSQTAATPETDSDNAATLAAQRVQELQQTKVEASQRFPITLTGMILFDAFEISGTKNDNFQSAYSDYSLGPPGGGGRLNQSVIGFEFNGPQIATGAKMSAFASMDFYASQSDYDAFRLRRAGISFDWGKRTLTFSQDKTLLSPLEPTSYVHVGVSPLAGAGNLWLWRPQVRYDEHIALPNSWMATVSGSVLETQEGYGSPWSPQDRPALQGRLEFKHTSDGNTDFAAGFGGHTSDSHLYGISVPSRLLSGDLKWKPLPWFELTGTIFKGRNIANLGALGPGISMVSGRPTAVPGAGGWVQGAFPITRRLTLDVYGGRQVNRVSDLTAFQIVRNTEVAGNVLYRVAPNVVLGFETGHALARYTNTNEIVERRFDATVAYLF
jgi:hypothetical protein